MSSRPTLEEEKRRDQVLRVLESCNVNDYESDVVDTLSRWLAQESKAAIQDKKSELASKGIPAEKVSKLILTSLGVESVDMNLG